MKKTAFIVFLCSSFALILNLSLQGAKKQKDDFLNHEMIELSFPQNLNLEQSVVANQAEKEDITLTVEPEANTLKGKAILPANNLEIKICNPELSPQSQIYLHSEDYLAGQVLFVKKKSAYDPETKECSHFIAGLRKPIDHDIDFEWRIIQPSL